MMLLTDLFGFVRRNQKNWSIEQTKKCLDEVNKIQSYLTRKLEGSYLK